MNFNFLLSIEQFVEIKFGMFILLVYITNFVKNNLIVEDLNC